MDAVNTRKEFGDWALEINTTMYNQNFFSVISYLQNFIEGVSCIQTSASVPCAYSKVIKGIHIIVSSDTKETAHT